MPVPKFGSKGSGAYDWLVHRHNFTAAYKYNERPSLLSRADHVDAMHAGCNREVTNQQTTFGVHRTSDMSENIFDKIIGPVMYDLSHMINVLILDWSFFEEIYRDEIDALFVKCSREFTTP